MERTGNMLMNLRSQNNTGNNRRVRAGKDFQADLRAIFLIFLKLCLAVQQALVEAGR